MVSNDWNLNPLPGDNLRVLGTRSVSDDSGFSSSVIGSIAFNSVSKYNNSSCVPCNRLSVTEKTQIEKNK